MNSDTSRRARFEALVLPHLDAAYNLARWLVRDANDAADVVQDALLRALRFFDGYRGGDVRAWLLAIVRNAAYAWLGARQPAELDDAALEQALDTESLWSEPVPDPETLAIRRGDAALVDAAIAALPIAFREVLILRELEDLSYRDIARVTELPMGTVMSRLARARRLLAQSLGAVARAANKEGRH